MINVRIELDVLDVEFDKPEPKNRKETEQRLRILLANIVSQGRITIRHAWLTPPKDDPDVLIRAVATPDGGWC